MAGLAPGPGPVYLGIGASTAATAADIRHLADAVLRAVGAAWSEVAAVATTERLAGDPRLGGLGRPVLGFPATQLAGVPSTEPSARARAAVGTPSVAEAAALLAAGPGAHLAVPKQRSALVTVALARR